MGERTIIEINGVKMDVDLSSAKRVDEIRIGDRVKVLTKDYSGHNVNPGVVVGFEPFKELPTIVVAYIAGKSWTANPELKFLHYNSASKDIEIVHAADEDFSVDREQALSMFDRGISTKEREIEALREQRTYFETHFRSFWSQVDAPVAA